MLIARAPLRISYAGGGTDLAEYFEPFGGMVVSATINRYFYVFVGSGEASSIQVTSADYRTFFRHAGERPLSWEGRDLALPRAILHEMGVFGGVTIFMASEVPPGTGLGSSSTVAVAIIKAMSALNGLEMDPAKIAEQAARIEIDKLGSPIGLQDQYAASYGGLNTIHFNRDGVRVEPISCSLETRRRLESCTMLFYTGQSRSANEILDEQRESSKRRGGPVVDSLHAIKEAAKETRAALESGTPDRIGAILHKSWQHKKTLAGGISNDAIDGAYDAAMAAGAAGGKVAGAGGGGFLLLYCDPASQPGVTSRLEDMGLSRMDFRFDAGGASILLNTLPKVVL